MTNIKILNDNLVNQIAAGEVIERPASVVKELCENSIDSNADNLEVEITAGGIKSIKVTDNGTGILKDDLSLSVQRHATSKIRTLEDLDSLYSLGFRGEALASIASVSRLRIMSATEENNAYMIEATNTNSNRELTPVAHPIGTTVLVNDLFYNTGARRKFLRRDITEYKKTKRLALESYESYFTPSAIESIFDYNKYRGSFLGLNNVTTLQNWFQLPSLY